MNLAGHAARDAGREAGGRRTPDAAERPADAGPQADRRAQPSALPPLRLPNWKTVRPAAEMYLPGEGCKWPDTDCREPRLPGRPYCCAHTARAYIACEAE